MSTFEIKYQETYSRAELILRSLFGYIYIALPHLFILAFLSIWGAILTFIAFWSILFTGRYPESMFEYQVKLIRWSTRVNARLYNLSDDYPAFGMEVQDEHINIDIPYPENLSRATLILKVLFGGFYVLLPHGFVLLFRILATLVLAFLAWWAVLFTGKYPESWFEFNVGTLRWGFRVNNYINLLTDEYPPFSGKP
jgi:TRAP-type mannitol/chloroaromatic compound transport system permease small subunit